jgi:NRAMP (natural resistance-associated macrophage protein)-like metal ion transporter
MENDLKEILTNQGKSGLWKYGKWVRYIGPGIITAALVFGPGSLTISSKLGARYEFQLLWVLVITAVLMMAFTSMGARIGMASKDSMLQNFRTKWGRWASVCAGVGIFLVSVSFQAGNTIAAAIAFADSFHTPALPWIIVVVGCSIGLLVFKSFYNILEKVMIGLVGMMLFSFILTLIISQPNLEQVGKGIIPSLPSGSLFLVIALVASTFSIGGAFYQSYLVQEKGGKIEEVNEVIKESISGIFILGAISAIILICGGAILYPKGIEVKSASDMGLALKPLYGKSAKALFMVGLFGASYSSLIGNATIGGTLLSDALSWGRDLSSRPVRICIAAVMIIGAIIAIIFGGLPLQLIVFAQGVTIFIVPFVGTGIFILANDKEIMGSLINKMGYNTLGILGLVVLFALAIVNFKNIFL